MKTVLLIVNHDITFYKFRKELAERLVKEHYRVIVVLPVTEETKKIEALGCEVIDVPVERRGRIRRMILNCFWHTGRS